MANFARDCRSTVIPALLYRDAPAAIEWLCRAFGFERQAVYEGPNGTIAHSQLTFGNGMVMVASLVEGSPFRALMRQPDEIGRRETQTPCLIVSDCDAIYAAAKSAGAEMVQAYRGYAVRRTCIHLSRPRGAPLVYRQLRSVGVKRP